MSKTNLAKQTMSCDDASGVATAEQEPTAAEIAELSSGLDRLAQSAARLADAVRQSADLYAAAASRLERGG